MQGPGAHVFIVTPETYPTHRDYCFCATGKGAADEITYQQFREPEVQKEWHGLVADLWNVRVGDYVFFYVTRQGFKGVYRVDSKPFFDATAIDSVPATRPLRILIKPLRLFDIPVPEDIVFSTPAYQKIFWVWYFNKMRDRGRGCNPFDPEARDKLIELLMKRNYGTSSIHSPKPYPSQAPMKQELKAIHLVHPDGKSVLREDTLRAAILKAMDEKGAGIVPIVGPLGDVEWYANNVPYHVSGSNIDILVYHRTEALSSSVPIAPRVQYSIVELKKDAADRESLDQLLDYCEWAGGQLAGGEPYMVKPVLVARRFAKDLTSHLQNLRLSYKPVTLVRYSLEEQGLAFTVEPCQQRNTK